MSETPELPPAAAAVAGDDPVVTVHEPAEPAAAAALDENGVVVGLELIDAAAPPQRDGITYRVLPDEERGDAVVGASWNGRGWDAPEAPAAPELAAAGLVDGYDGAWLADLRRDTDAALALILGAQLGTAPDGIDWPAVLGGMVARGTAETDELDGAKAWKLLDAAAHATLVAQLRERAE